jgi:hypothetical protein
MKIPLAVLCALGIGSASAQTFRTYPDLTLEGIHTFHYEYADATPALAVKSVRLWAVASTTNQSATVTFTWKRGNVTATKTDTMNNYGLRRFAVETSDLIGLPPQGAWSLTVQSTNAVFLQDWGVSELTTNLPPLQKQYCVIHRDEGAIVDRGVVRGDGGITTPQTNTVWIAYGHTKDGAFCGWTNAAFVISAPQYNKKDK